METKKLIGTKIDTLWEKFKEEEFCKVPPIAIAELPSKPLVFIGINPSMTDKLASIFETKKDRHCEFFSLEEYRESAPAYFKKFGEISEKTGLDWGHMDLLYVVETNQSKIKEIGETENEQEFISTQCEISKSILDKIIDEKNARIFVVNNTLARDFFGCCESESSSQNQGYFDYDFVWDDELGTYKYKNNPFFFTSMLSGQRALDNGSLERLIWHITFVKNKMKKN